MSELMSKVAFLKGMAEGMELREDTVQNKLLLHMLETLEEMAGEMQSLSERIDEQARYVDDMDEDLGALEEAVFGDEDEEDEDDGCGCCGHDDGCDCEDDEDGGEAVDFIEYECPHCGAAVYYDQEAFDLEEEHPCPSCGKELFPAAPDGE